MVATISLLPLYSDEVRKDPFTFYARLHSLGPVCRVAEGEGERYNYVVHGFRAAEQVLKDPKFHVMDVTHASRPPTWAENRAQSVLFNCMFFVNEPRHMRMRRMFNQTFTARRIANLEGAIGQIADELLDGMAKDGPLDFMSEFAFPLPANVLGELLGVPDEDRAWYRPRALALGALLELGEKSPEVVRAADAAAVEITAYFAELAARRRVEQGDDLVSALVAALEVDSTPLNEQELIANLIVLFNAGFVTTTHLLGNGLTLLLDRPDLVADLRNRPELASAYVEEILRVQPSTHFAVRYAAADTEVAGVPVPGGSWVLVLLAAANRDPARFPDPDVFDPTRPDNHTLTFGSGAHYCLGAPLARLEGARGFLRLFGRFPNISVAAPPAAPNQLTLRGYDELLVSLT